MIKGFSEDGGTEAFAVRKRYLLVPAYECQDDRPSPEKTLNVFSQKSRHFDSHPATAAEIRSPF